MTGPEGARSRSRSSDFFDPTPTVFTRDDYVAAHGRHDASTQARRHARASDLGVGWEELWRSLETTPAACPSRRQHAHSREFCSGSLERGHLDGTGAKVVRVDEAIDETRLR